MKRQIYLYLFLVTALVLLFVIVNTKKDTQSFEKRISKLEKRIKDNGEKYQDTIANLRLEVLESSNFSLAEDPYAQEYLFKQGIDFKELNQHIEDQIISMNTNEGGNPLVDFEAMASDAMLINSIKMLNHNWVIADFTDGRYWGQILIRCFYNEDNSIDLKAIDQFLYPADVTK